MIAAHVRLTQVVDYDAGLKPDVFRGVDIVFCCLGALLSAALLIAFFDRHNHQTSRLTSAILQNRSRLHDERGESCESCGFVAAVVCCLTAVQVWLTFRW